MLATAQTGTGKTLAFLIPVIEMLQREPSQKARVLVLLPTRELAIQVNEEYEKLRGSGLSRKLHWSSAASLRRRRFRRCEAGQAW